MKYIKKIYTRQVMDNVYTLLLSDYMKQNNLLYINNIPTKL